MFKGFFNTFPHPEEVLIIDRSSFRRKAHDVVLESYIDFGFKKEITRLYAIGYLMRRQLLNPISHKAFEPNHYLNKAFHELYVYKGLKECHHISNQLK